MFNRKQQLVGLDIGSSYVKIVQLAEKGAEFKLLNLGVVPLPSGTVKEGRVLNSEALVQCVKVLTKNLKVKEKKVASAVSGYEVMIKKLEIPVMTEEELNARMQTELRQYIPYSLEEVDVDYEILGISKERSGNMDVLLVAAKKESIRDYVSAVEACGLNVHVLDVDYFALNNALEMTQGFREDCLALIDIGSHKALMCIAVQGVPVFTRGLAIGGEQITEQISEQLKVTLEEAERLKLGDASLGISTAELERVFVSVIQSWVGECKRAIDFYHSNYPDNGLKKIYLSGGSCRLPGLEQVFREHMDVEVSIFNPLEHIQWDSNGFDGDYLNYIGPQMAIPLGLALRKTKEK